ncbi:50S ribosomal protein L2 [Candidatus Woesearchaeota archaeon CG10_big_fil_rev_8_21_14_0_10_30_7]|nr:MAG: 50S ribosomal protein L2 [Candidatus Woesearchaeota archaeon CG10_big_fil_rev_8_21_14_0_10_30_7]
MGKNLIQQARGKGSHTYRAPSFNYKGKAKLSRITNNLEKGQIIDLVKCPGHDAPLAQIKYNNGETILVSAPENIKVGEYVTAGPGSEIKPGNVLTLREIPDGTNIYNIESQPGDGGKYCRSSGTSARLISKTETTAVLKLPSKKEKEINLDCRAVIGIICASGRKEKPYLKAGIKMHAMRAKNKLYPRSKACAMNAVDHPYGNKRSARKAKQKATSRHAPPGRKVGKLAPRRTGRKK